MQKVVWAVLSRNWAPVATFCALNRPRRARLTHLSVMATATNANICGQAVPRAAWMTGNYDARRRRSRHFGAWVLVYTVWWSHRKEGPSRLAKCTRSMHQLFLVLWAEYLSQYSVRLRTADRTADHHRVAIPDRGRGYLFSTSWVQTGHGAHPASYPICLRGSFNFLLYNLTEIFSTSWHITDSHTV
jgi:hypothetical protein